MSTKWLSAFVMVAALFISVVNAADETKKTDQQKLEMQKQQQKAHQGMQRSDQASSTIKISELLGRKVENNQGEQLGNITDIVIDMDRGQVAYAVLSFGGFLGMGDKLFAIPFTALKDSPQRRSFVLNVDKEKLKQAPGFDKNQWPETGNRQWGTDVHRFYGEQPYWERSDTQSQTPADRTQQPATPTPQR